jgi:hypothetical protein
VIVTGDLAALNLMTLPWISQGPVVVMHGSPDSFRPGIVICTNDPDINTMSKTHITLNWTLTPGLTLFLTISAATKSNGFSYY